MKRGEVYLTLKQWLKVNGIANVKFGWLAPGNEAFGTCEFPVACLIPQHQNLTSLDTGPATVEREEVMVVVWGIPGESAFSDDMGGFMGLWQVRDRLLAADTGLAALRQRVNGVPASPFLSTECDISVTAYEDYWYALDIGGFPAFELTLQISNRIGPAVLS